MSIILELLLDGLMIVLLGAMIFYSIRLSMALKTFRESRNELAALLEDLSDNIVQAEQAIMGLRETANESGNELQEIINKGRALSEELQFINEAGDNLARRLENAVSHRGTSRQPPLEGAEKDGEEAYYSSPELEKIFRKPEKIAGHNSSSGKKDQGHVPGIFAIRDRDFDRGEKPASLTVEQFVEESGGQEEKTENFRTHAERNLYKALKQKRRKRAGE
jgi:hypothetical protein